MDKFKIVMKDKISSFLPSAFNRALCSYRTFTSKNTDMETKEFSAYHSACKNALSHIDNLIKLSKFSEDDEISTKEIEDNSLAKILKEAKNELEQINMQS